MHCIYYRNTIFYGHALENWASDYPVFYYAGKQILINPADLYEVYHFLNMPSFAIFFAFTFSLLPYRISYYTYYLISYLSGVLAIFEFNRILILMDVKRKAHRFIFLIIISNSQFLWLIFYFNQNKFLVFLILLFIIRKEIQYRKEDREKNIKYYILIYGLFVFILGVSPYFIFLLFIYLFQEIKLKDIVKKESLKKYLIIVLWFIIQNFLFLLYPSLIFEFLKGFNRPVSEIKGSNPLFLKDFIDINSSQNTVMRNVFTLILVIITVVLILIRTLRIELKFSLFLLAYLFFGIYSFVLFISYISCSFILFLFVPFLKQDVKGYDFMRKNIILLIGMISILGIFLFTNDFFFWVFFPVIYEIEFGIFETYRLLVLHIIMLVSIFILYIKKYKFPDLENI